MFVSRSAPAIFLLATVPCLFGQTAPATTAAPAPVVHAPFPAGDTTPLGKKIAALLSQPEATHTHWGIAVTTLEGTPVYGYEEGKLFRPASNNKLFTSAAAMALLGPQQTITTQITAAGKPDERGVLTGDITLTGAGDANLSGRAFPYDATPHHDAPQPDPLLAIDDLAQQLQARGVRHITGNVVADDSRWPQEPFAEGYAYEDVDWCYGAGVSSLAVNDSCLELTIHPGTRAGEPVTVTVSPDVGMFRVENYATTSATGSKTQIRIDRDPGSTTVRISGHVALGGIDHENLAVEDPAMFAAQALVTRLRARGVIVNGVASVKHEANFDTDDFQPEARVPLTGLPLLATKAAPDPPLPAGAQVLAKRTSPPLYQDVAYTLKESDNLHAEMLLRRLGETYGTRGSFAQGARVVRQWLTTAGLDPEDFVFYDGSGLSAKDLVAPRATAALLAFAAKQPWFAQWKAALPVGGIDGTISNRFKEAPLKGHVFAKTGTLGESVGLSGYVDCASGKTLIFSIYADDHAPGSTPTRKIVDAIVAAIAAEN